MTDELLAILPTDKRLSMTTVVDGVRRLIGVITVGDDAGRPAGGIHLPDIFRAKIV